MTRLHTWGKGTCSSHHVPGHAFFSSCLGKAKVAPTQYIHQSSLAFTFTDSSGPATSLSHTDRFISIYRQYDRARNGASLSLVLLVAFFFFFCVFFLFFLFFCPFHDCFWGGLASCSGGGRRSNTVAVDDHKACAASLSDRPNKKETCTPIFWNIMIREVSPALCACVCVPMCGPRALFVTLPVPSHPRAFLPPFIMFLPRPQFVKRMRV